MSSSYDTSEDVATTPRPTQTSFAQSASYATQDQSNMQTPTRDTFQTEVGQMPPPNTSPSAGGSYETTGRTRRRGDSIDRSQSLRSGHTDGSGTPVAGVVEARVGSDGGSADDEDRPQKKKKGQRFYCTDYPPCNLSFTRSEHLARHIRKHTGERPFQCHCLRRFSRLDNLRQHAQTVHLNEDIPQDSLAATGTRFQRQIRTDRVRTPGGRARASTLGSQTSAPRGHSRNVSSTSIGSTSEFPALDHFTSGQQQVPPMSMPPPSTPGRSGLGLDTNAANAAGPDHPYFPYYTQNAGYGSPTSVYSTDSPLAHPGLQSPNFPAMVPRGMNYLDSGHGRRMSVPGGAMHFQSPSSYGSNMGFMGSTGSSNASSYSNATMLTSPTSSNFSDPQDFVSETELKRRTWHPGSYSSYGQRPATSGLSYHQTPDAPNPSQSTQSAAAQTNVRLPGIDSFDRSTSRPAAAPGRVVSPMEVEQGSRQQYAGDSQHLSQRHPHQRSHHYSQSAPQSLEHAAQQMQANANASTPHDQRRQGWYSGPTNQAMNNQEAPAVRTSPASSTSDAPHTPSGLSQQDFQPAIVHSNGAIEPLPHGALDPSKVPHIMQASRSLQNTMQSSAPQDQSPTRHSGDMDRLEALVAVASSAAKGR